MTDERLERLKALLRLHKSDRKAETSEEKSLLRDCLEKHLRKGFDHDDSALFNELSE